MTRQSEPLLACQKREFWHAAVERPIVLQALKIAFIVGIILMAINQGDAIVNGEPVNWIKVVLTFMVPYGVSTYSAAAFKVMHH